jgi:Zn-dependent protease/CBS domain-containing protein
MVLFRIKGVPVKIGLSWVVIFALVFWSLAAAMFPSTYPGLSVWAYVAMAGVATLLFFASILVHELSHTLQSLREGVKVRDITLWLFGGVSRAEEPLPGPGAEFRVVAAGPLASGVLALLFWGLATGGAALGLPETWTGVPRYLAGINALLLAFNVVPALPLDGGRLLHALLWWRSGDDAGATIIAARAGQLVAVVLIAAGVFVTLTRTNLSGIWFVLLGWFIGQAARQEAQGARVTQALRGQRVRDLMAAAPITLRPDTTLDEVAVLLQQGLSHPVYPVVDHGRFAGLLVLRRAGRVPVSQRGTTLVGDLMERADAVPVLHPEDLVVDAVPTLARAPGRAVVLAADLGQVVGILSESDLVRALELTPDGDPGRRTDAH